MNDKQALESLLKTLMEKGLIGVFDDKIWFNPSLFSDEVMKEVEQKGEK